MEIRLCYEELKCKNLISRNAIIPIREKAIKEIQNAPEYTTFYYDFSDIKAITGSGIDEIITKVMNHLIEHEANKYLYLKDLREDDYEHKYNIDGFLKSRSKIGIVTKTHNEVDFLGDISKTYLEILNIVYNKKSVTARDVADILNKQINVASTHLTKLYKQRLIMRKESPLIEGGRQFIYEPVF